MERFTVSAAIVFGALGIVGILLAVAAGSLGVTADAADAIRSIGASMFGAGLAAFLVVAFLGSAPRSSP